MSQQKYLNLGCGRIILPAERPAHHALVNPAIYQYPLWHNVDRNGEPGVDECFDLFTYPWPLESDAYDGALLSHLAEHIPHEIRIDPGNLPIGRAEHAATMESEVRIRLDMSTLSTRAAHMHRLAELQDGWYAFFAELYRVLTPGAIVHILSPYGWSQGGITDPTHTRLLTEHTFSHSMQPDPNSPFKYATGGINFEMVGVNFGVYPMFTHLLPTERDNPQEVARKQALFQEELMTRINVVNDLYVQLRVVK
jgi:hypothetical protein